MLVGHFAVAFGAKRLVPSLSLGTLTLAAMLADFLWAVLLLAGVEHVDIRPGLRGAANYVVMRNVAWSHSLLMTTAWGAIFAGVYFALWGNKRGSGLLFAAVVSHWVLDFVSSPPALALAPGEAARFGLGLWSSVPATLAVEGGIWLAAIILYLRGTRSRGPVASAALWTGIALLTLIWYDNIAGLPHAPRPQPVVSLIVFALFVGWMFWINRTHPVRS
jgi:hypothetical protein